MKKILFLLLISASFAYTQSVTISPGGITPGLTGTYPRISYDEILAIPSPVLGQEAYDLTFLCMRVYNGTLWVCSFQLPNEPISDLALITSMGGASEDKAFSLAVDASGNVYVTGYYAGTVSFGSTSKTSVGSDDIFVAKYNTVGELQWVQSAGGASDDQGYSIAIDASGNVYVAGSFLGAATFGSTIMISAGGYDVFVAKYNTNGDLQWVQSAGGTSIDRARSIAIDGSGNVYVTGSFSGMATFGLTSKTSAGFLDIFISKYNSNGNLQWVQFIGGPAYDNVNSIAVDASENVYITGYYTGTAAFGATNKTSAGSADIFIAKYNTNGALQWVQSEGGTSADYGQSVVIDGSGDLFVTGSYSGTATFGSSSKTSAGRDDIFIAKYNSNGDLQWVQFAGGTLYDRGYSIAVDVSGNVFVTGSYEGTATFGSTNKTSVGDSDIFIAKYNTSGDLQWVEYAGGASYDYGRSVAVDGSGNVFVTGYFEETATFGATSKISAGETDIFLVRLSQ